MNNFPTLIANIALAAADNAIRSHEWGTDVRPAQGVQILRNAIAKPPECAVPFHGETDALFASRLESELEEERGELPEAEHHALRTLHYAFATLDDCLYLRHLTRHNVLDNEDVAECLSDLLKTLQHALGATSDPRELERDLQRTLRK